MRIEFEFGDTGGAAPAQVAERERSRRQAEAEAAIQADPFVRSVLDEFGGRITQIKPLS